jgi:hypothetical protein
MPFSPRYVSTTGNDDTGTGSALRPFRTLGRATADTTPPPATILLYGGTYLDNVDLTDIGSDHPITIQSVPGQRAVIESAARDIQDDAVHFRDVPNTDWKPGDFEDEYISTLPFPPDTDHGAFLNLPGHPHLITYSNLKDFRSTTQQWGQLLPSETSPGDAFEFVEAFKQEKEDDHFVCLPLGFRRPYVYMGPGLLQDDDGYIHIRLSHTDNQVPGYPDYQGERDPRLVRLAIWTFGPTLTLTKCHNVRLHDITLRFGSHTLRIDKSQDLQLDHVRIDAGQYGVRFGQNCQRISMRDCIIDGGLPTWSFRSDHKDTYHYLELDGSCTPNNLGANTTKSLIHGTPDCVDTVIENCEFRTGHDLYLFGTNTVCRKNWISNLNDDALVLDAEGVQNLRVSENVIEQCLTALSFAQEHVVGPVYIYRNLIDLRRPTAGVRPHWNPDTVDPLRYGHLFKDNKPTGPLDLVHNTFVVTRQHDGPVSYGHFTGWDHQHRRRSLNNIFVAVNPEPVHDRPITDLPTPPGPGVAQGNCYHRKGHHSAALFRFLDYPDPITGNNVPGTSIANVPTLHAHQLGGLGVETHSLEDDPRFKRFTAGPTLFHPVDLRLDDGSPCRGAAADLPSDLPTDTSPGSPDIGCYPADSLPLAVGVDGKCMLPAELIDAPVSPAETS